QSVGGVGRIVGVAKVDAKLIGVRNVAFALSTEAFTIQLRVILFQLPIFFFELSNHVLAARDFFLRISQLFISSRDFFCRSIDFFRRISQLLIALSECDLLLAEQFKQLRLRRVDEAASETLRDANHSRACE
ncbi:MAG: hypothetical protein R3C28_29305, partial [Pirellulaceae bacterium]